MIFSSACLSNMTHRLVPSRFCWCLFCFMLLHSQSTKLLSKAASPWPETEPDAASRVPCGGNVAHHPWTVALPSELIDPWSNVDMHSVDFAVQPLSIRETSADAKITCALEEADICGVGLSEGSSFLSGNGIGTILLRDSQRPGSGKASGSHSNIPPEVQQTDHNIKLPEHACHFNRPNPPAMSMQPEHDPASSTSTGHDTNVFEAELKKGNKPPRAGEPSPIHNSIPDSETLNQVDVSSTSNRLNLLKAEPGSGGHGQELAAKDGHEAATLENIGDSSNLHNILARSTGRQDAGSPSRGHNSVLDGAASE
ncbi:hypothetical protein M758_6G111200 [Ceratodon purpureus]|nr:hypothetical protein M758_6G111200 [Ceratodon purpureus]